MQQLVKRSRAYIFDKGIGGVGQRPCVHAGMRVLDVYAAIVFRAVHNYARDQGVPLSMNS